ncbi:MAG TPA: hypothetical protein V6C97_27565, partial [Oculatellaceae cyanobacterium]
MHATFHQPTTRTEGLLQAKLFCLANGGECKRSAVVPPQDELLRSTDFFLRCIRERTIPADLPL